jgi:hypothetical protein
MIHVILYYNLKHLFLTAKMTVINNNCIKVVLIICMVFLVYYQLSLVALSLQLQPKKIISDKSKHLINFSLQFYIFLKHFNSNNTFKSLYKFYPSRIPSINSTDYINENLIVSDKYKDGGLGRTAGEQAGYQIAALFMTLGMAVIGGIVTGLILRLPVFEQVDKIELMFDDEESWLIPSDFKTSSFSNNEETGKNDH